MLFFCRSQNSHSSDTNSSTTGSNNIVNKNQMRKQFSGKKFSRCIAATVPELVKILGGKKPIEKVKDTYQLCYKWYARHSTDNTKL